MSTFYVVYTRGHHVYSTSYVELMRCHLLNSTCYAEYYTRCHHVNFNSACCINEMVSCTFNLLCCIYEMSSGKLNLLRRIYEMVYCKLEIHLVMVYLRDVTMLI